jgi:hypothetical protein
MTAEVPEPSRGLDDALAATAAAYGFEGIDGATLLTAMIRSVASNLIEQTSDDPRAPVSEERFRAAATAASKILFVIGRPR